MLGSGTQTTLLPSPDQHSSAKETKLPTSRASKRLGKTGVELLLFPLEKLMKKPPLPDPRGIWLYADVIGRREAKGKEPRPQPPACLLPEAQQGSCSWSGGTGAQQDVGALEGSLTQPGWRAAREAEAFETASTGWGAPRSPSQVALGWTQTPPQSLRRAVEGVYDKAGCRQSQKAERGACDPDNQEVRA